LGGRESRKARLRFDAPASDSRRAIASVALAMTGAAVVAALAAAISADVADATRIRIGALRVQVHKGSH